MAQWWLTLLMRPTMLTTTPSHHRRITKSHTTFTYKGLFILYWNTVASLAVTLTQNFTYFFIDASLEEVFWCLPRPSLDVYLLSSGKWPISNSHWWGDTGWGRCCWLSCIINTLNNINCLTPEQVKTQIYTNTTASAVFIIHLCDCVSPKVHQHCQF